MNDLQLIKSLSNAYGAPGYEDNILELVKETCKDLDIENDSLMNTYIRKDKKEKPFTIMLDAHMDEVGFMVQSITKKGLIKFIPLGGWVTHNIPAHLVMIRDNDNKYVKGVVTSKPPHFMTADEKEKKISIDQLTIDVGASSREEVIDIYKISLGAPIVPFVDFDYNEKTKVMMGKAFDNRLGCAAVIKTIQAYTENDKIQVVGALAVQEEVGTRGAQVTSNTVKPDLAIVFEGTPADDVYLDDTAQGALGKGPQIRFRDNSYVAHHRFIEYAHKIAKEYKIPYQDAVRVSGGTNAGKIHLSNQGVPTLVLGVPSRYIHTHHSYASLEDFKNTVKLAVEIIHHLNDDTIKHILRR
ncbi:M42 family metallopeptidase [Acidaminobacter sp. JC074]|uniref:M42 family metallopeptidase n=1 Tax=Acidaminobacter sp. JC074 TaxID=2530199 RepID=UPI001F0CF214|nr:M20/M25/M40 family metallo-hydrolase [Acidaminobacter sp. JC074]MCH4886333.1 M42 family metallopeptidase [Acidaminobacter sp. JC074]